MDRAVDVLAGLTTVGLCGAVVAALGSWYGSRGLAMAFRGSDPKDRPAILCAYGTAGRPWRRPHRERSSR